MPFKYFVYATLALLPVHLSLDTDRHGAAEPVKRRL